MLEFAYDTVIENDFESWLWRRGSVIPALRRLRSFHVEAAV